MAAFDEVGHAATHAAATGTAWFTSDEFAPAVVIHDRADECTFCGSALPCPNGTTEEEHG